jgi:hypothetical protein
VEGGRGIGLEDAADYLAVRHYIVIVIIPAEARLR